MSMYNSWMGEYGQQKPVSEKKYLDGPNNLNGEPENRNVSFPTT
jgi:hypothetical protein